jgi:hypothetical protein
MRGAGMGEGRPRMNGDRGCTQCAPPGGAAVGVHPRFGLRPPAPGGRAAYFTTNLASALSGPFGVSMVAFAV